MTTYTFDEVMHWLDECNSVGIEPDMARQLLATMQREAELREAMLEAHRLIAEGEIFEATAILKILGENTSKYRDDDTVDWGGNPEIPTRINVANLCRIKERGFTHD
jgi:hypothetical protein